MKLHCPWLSLLANCILLVSGAAFVFAIVLAGASVALAGHQAAEAQESQTAAPLVQPESGRSEFTGMVTDSHCGARHMRNSGQNSTECIRACVHRGATYVLVDGNHRYTLIGDDSAFAELAGERANVTGTRQGETIIVDAEAPVF